MKLWWIAAPILVAALWVAVRALRGRPVPRTTVSIIVSLLLLGYFLATAGLGLFWVGRMDLPAFDLHYLVGYCLTLLAMLHVALHLPVLAVFLRKHSPAKLLSDDGSRFRRGVKVGAGSAVVLVALTPLVWLATCARPGPARTQVRASSPGASAGSATSEQEGVQVWIDTESGRQSAVAYLHEQSSHSRSAVFREPRVMVRTAPPPTKSLPDASRIPLPPPARRAGMTVHRALQQVRAAYAGGVASEGDTGRDESRPSAVSSADHRATEARSRIVVEKPLAAPRVSLTTVAQLLHYAAGVTSPHAVGSGILLRAAPSAGALYPVDVYIAVRDVEGLEAGIYYYDPHRHALLRTGGADAVQRLAGHVAGGQRVRAAPFSLVLGATFDRTVAKYRSRAYRYVTLDAGHLAAHVALTGAALGTRCELEPLFEDEAVAGIVGAGSGEGVLLVVPCGVGAASGETDRLSIPAHEPPELPESPEAQELSRLSHRLTSWRLLEQMPRQLDLTGVPSPPQAEPTRLPEPAVSDRDLFETITARRSFRDFSARPVPAEEFAGVLADAHAHALRVRPQAFIELYVFVRAVESVAPGLYRYHPERHALELVRAGEVASAIQSAGFSQELLGRAAFALAWTARLDLIEQTDGARGYRHALLDAGLAGEHAYLSAVARRLGICGAGAFYDGAVNRLLGPNRGERVALYLQGVGQRE